MIQVLSEYDEENHKETA